MTSAVSAHDASLFPQQASAGPFRRLSSPEFPEPSGSAPVGAPEEGPDPLVAERPGLVGRAQAHPRRTLWIAGAAGSVLVAGAALLVARPHHPAVPPVVHEVGVVAAPVAPGTAHPRTADNLARDSDLKLMLAAKLAPKPAPKPVIAAPAAPTVVVAKSPAVTKTVTAPADALTQTAHLQAAPMSAPEQVQVLQLVTEVAALVEHERAEIASVRNDLAHLQGGDTDKVSDLTRRVTMLEAKRAVAEASAPPADPAVDTSTALHKAREAVLAARAAPDTPPVVSATPRAEIPAWSPHYRILAASPQLAMVQDDAAPAGRPSQYEIVVGTQLAGYGRVRAIAQQGTLWVIQTDHGVIQ